MLRDSSFSRYSDSLRAWRSGYRIPVGARFSEPAQTGHEFHPASYTMGTGSFQGVKRPGRGVDHPPPSSAEVKERVELYIYSPSGPSCPVLGWTFHLPFIALPYVRYKKFNIYMCVCVCVCVHFVLSLKIMCLNVWWYWVRPKHVAGVDMTETICCGWRQHVNMMCHSGMDFPTKQMNKK